MIGHNPALIVGDTLAPDAPRGLGKMMAGGGDKVKRRPRDFYPTPPEATRALLAAERGALRDHGPLVWEPCGHGGAIADVLRADGFTTVATDVLADPAHDVAALDLLEATRPRALSVVTNPPFAIARQIIVRLLDRLEVEYCALLLKTQFWNSGKGCDLWREHPPTRRWDMTWRLDFTGGGDPTMTTTWFVWDRRGNPGFGLLDRDGPVGFVPTLFNQGETA